MNLNYTAFFLISFIPLLIASLWYHPNSPILQWSGVTIANLLKMKPLKILFAFVLSFALVYGYINVIIHQMGFYELFFTDIMMGKAEAQQIVTDFMRQYEDKHRHFGHGMFHGAINAFVFALPFIGLHALLTEQSGRSVLLHFSYWLLTSTLMGGLISEFV